MSGRPARARPTHPARKLEARNKNGEGRTVGECVASESIWAKFEAVKSRAWWLGSVEVIAGRGGVSLLRTARRKL